MQYIFVHGRIASLSMAELEAIFGKELSYRHPQFSIVNTQQVVDQKFLNTLGGTARIAQIEEKKPEELILENAKTDKILFGISQFGGHEALSDHLIRVKKTLKALGRNARFINKNFKSLNSAQIRKSGLLEKGIELIRVFVNGKECWGKTVAVQDIDAYGIRDFEKPCRDMNMGMMPPKLAQMMVNLAKPLPSTTLYDPFCGLGTVLQEAVLRGNPIMGSDLKTPMVEGTKKNLLWLEKTFSCKVQGLANIFQHDARRPISRPLPEDVAVVTEGYLGPAQTFTPPALEQKKIFETIHAIKSDFLSFLRQKIRKGNRVVLCVPYFKTKDQPIFFPDVFLKHYESLGYEFQYPFHSLLYDRETQRVGREIIVLRPTTA